MLARVRKSRIGVALLLEVRAGSSRVTIVVLSFLLVYCLCVAGDDLVILMVMSGGITSSSLNKRGSFAGDVL